DNFFLTKLCRNRDTLLTPTETEQNRENKTLQNPTSTHFFFFLLATHKTYTRKRDSNKTISFYFLLLLADTPHTQTEAKNKSKKDNKKNLTTNILPCRQHQQKHKGGSGQRSSENQGEGESSPKQQKRSKRSKVVLILDEIR
ncbi:unnamed protein product, partial [Linum tenue]